MAAGLFGVIGAAIGGAAAAWGARSGAERTARAAQQQVHDQAIAEHAHWLRQQRLEAYEGFMRAYDSFARVATDGLRAAEERRSRSDQSGRDDQLSEYLLSASEVEALGHQVRALEERSARISVLGPSSVDECAAELTRAAGLEHQRYEQGLDWNEVRSQTEHRNRFLAAARQALGTRPDLTPVGPA
ncbi:hypothetical protein ACFQ7M_38035 [Streptomyces massasporeus]